jgi:hypothetical protein
MWHSPSWVQLQVNWSETSSTQVPLSGKVLQWHSHILVTTHWYKKSTHLVYRPRKNLQCHFLQIDFNQFLNPCLFHHQLQTPSGTSSKKKYLENFLFTPKSSLDPQPHPSLLKQFSLPSGQGVSEGFSAELTRDYIWWGKGKSIDEH